MSGLELYIVVLPIIVGIIGIQYELHKIRKLLENKQVINEFKSKRGKRSI